MSKQETLPTIRWRWRLVIDGGRTIAKATGVEFDSMAAATIAAKYATERSTDYRVEKVYSWPDPS